MSDIKFECPHCAHHYIDDMELLDANELHDFKCESCDKPFHILVQECPKCTAETVFVYKTTPTWEAVALLACGSCGNSFNNLEAVEEDD